MPAFILLIVFSEIYRLMFRRNFPKNWKSSEHLTTAGIAYDFVRTASASSRDSFIASNGPTGRDLFAYACTRLWFLASYFDCSQLL
ncbi:MAG: hypothetical protein DME78_09080 [Verrucomicrobia bacterium]|nr:MAG: hypothetical protein DME78_09080 [Verrucomicrobiota bacterium]